MADQQLVVEVISPDAPKTGAAQGRWASAPFVAGAVLVALGVGALATAPQRARAPQLRLTSHPLVRGGMAAAAALAIGAPVYAAADAPAPMVSEFARLPSVQLEDAPTVSVNKAELKARLTPLQFQVAVEGGTEPAFKNEYWNENRKGTYVSVVSGRPLFRSEDKYDSGTGWPSFTRPVSEDAVVYRKDYSYGMTRVENGRPLNPAPPCAEHITSRCKQLVQNLRRSEHPQQALPSQQAKRGFGRRVRFVPDSNQ